jgi:hypothetical protein
MAAPNMMASSTASNQYVHDYAELRGRKILQGSITPEIEKRIAKTSSGGKMSITSLMARKLERQRIDDEVIIMRTLEVVIMTHSHVFVFT